MPVASLLVWASVECRALPLCSCLKIAHRKSEGALPVYSRSSWSLAQLLRIGLIMGWRYTFLHQRNNGGVLSPSQLYLVATCSSDSSFLTRLHPGLRKKDGTTNHCKFC